MSTLFALGFGSKVLLHVRTLLSKLKGEVSKPKATAALAVILNILATPQPFISLFILQFIPPLPLCRRARGQSRDFEVALPREERESLWLISCSYPSSRSSSLHQFAGSEEEPEPVSPPRTSCCMLQIPFTLCYTPELAASDKLTRTDTKLQIRRMLPHSAKCKVR